MDPHTTRTPVFRVCLLLALRFFHRKFLRPFSSETGSEAPGGYIYRISVRRGCGLLMQSRTVYHWQSRRDERAITLRIHIQLRREGWPVNHKKTHRIYCPEGLNLRRKRPRRHVSAARRQQRPVLTHVDQCWSMDFVSDNLFNGRRFRR